MAENTFDNFVYSVRSEVTRRQAQVSGARARRGAWRRHTLESGRSGVAAPCIRSKTRSKHPIHEVWHAIEQEYRRQEEHIELIASENYASPRVLHAQGSVLTNKYAEGYPGKRYYGGCEYVDIAEQLAIDRAKALFGAGYANVQPHSGAQANQAVFFATLHPGDTILGMSLGHGGHLTHGASVNISGRYFDAVTYGLDPETEAIDYAEVEELAHVKKPKLIVAGASAYSLVIDWKRFRAIADQVGALLHGRHGALRGPRRGGPLSEPGRHRRLRHDAPRTRRCAVRAAG